MFIESFFYKDVHDNYTSSTSKGIELEVEIDAALPSHNIDHEKKVEVSIITMPIDIETNKINNGNNDRINEDIDHP